MKKNIAPSAFISAMSWTQSPVLIRVRLIASGVLFVYVLTHFFNHSLGLISLEIMEAGRLVFLGFWRNIVFQWLFPLVFLLHTQSAIWRLMFRESWQFSIRQKAQIASGISIPFFLFLHIAATRMQWAAFGYEDTYAYFLHEYLQNGGVLFFALMSVIVWVHAFFGITANLDLRPWFAKIRSAFLIIYTAIPVLGFAGLIAAYNQILKMAKEPAWANRFLTPPGDPAQLRISIIIFYFSGLAIVGAIIGVLFLMRLSILKKQQRLKSIEVSYVDGPVVMTHSGPSVLEVSLSNNIDHAHVCGGNGRCSTCRVKVLGGQDNLSPAGSAELALLKKVEAGPNARLGCQAHVRGNIKIARLINPAKAKDAVLKNRGVADGVEKEIIVMFCDLQGFTSFSERKLPYDVVFVLNQYFKGMGRIIEEYNGHIDKFIGDGIMAIFGLKKDIQQSANDALAATFAMKDQLSKINQLLMEEMQSPLKIRIGIHAGFAIVGELGYGSAMNLTAIGDVVNTASRMEHANKKLGTWLLVSQKIIDLSGQSLQGEQRLKIRLRGKQDVLKVHGFTT